MTINISKFVKELEAAGIANGGCNISGVVWDVDGTTEIQDRPDVSAAIAAHDPAPEPEPEYIEYEKPVKAPDFIVATPKIKDNPLQALTEAVTEMKKGEGNSKSIALIVLSLAKYLEHDSLEKETLKAEVADLKKKAK